MRAHRKQRSAPSPRELLESSEKVPRYCNLCPRLCHHSCPVSNAERDEAVTPGNKSLTAGVIAGGGSPNELVTDLFHKCADCRLCTAFCGHENDVSATLMSARAVAAEAGMEPPAVVALGKSFESFGNAWEEDLSLRLRDMIPRHRRLGVQGPVVEERSRGTVTSIKERGLRVYWPGCAAVARRPDLVSLTLEVCDLLGEPDISVYCGDDVQCCGYPLLASGRHEAFVAQARKASKALSGADVVFTASPECAWTFSTAWPERAGVEPPAPRIAHVVDLILPALRYAPARPPLDLDAVYHDPCYLGRHLGRCDEPRALVNRLLRTPMAEAGSWVREQGYCCGAGGVLEATNPDTSYAVTRARLGHLLGKTTGPPGELEPGKVTESVGGRRHIVTACVRCESRFSELMPPPQVLDIVDVVALYLGLKDNGGGTRGAGGDIRGK